MGEPPAPERIRRALILPTIVFAQFAGTSLWFAPNAVLSQIEQFGAGNEVAVLTSLVQLGFIAGTFTLTYFAVADRFSAPLIFALMSLAGAACNAACVTTTSFGAWCVLRALVGVCMAGIYPVGMRIAARQYPDGLGGRLGLVIGALTLGTAFPWLLRALGPASASAPASASGAASASDASGAGPGSAQGAAAAGAGGLEAAGWRATLGLVSALAALGGLLMPAILLTPGTRLAAVQTFTACSCGRRAAGAPAAGAEDAPAGGGHGLQVGPESVRAMLRGREFRAAALGYFGHMWELYAFWAYLPALVRAHGAGAAARADAAPPPLSAEMTVFVAIAAGAPASVLAGVVSLRAGTAEVPGSALAALFALSVSLACCLAAPLYQRLSPPLFTAYVVLWGGAVVADSGQFSSLCAAFALREYVGTALTLTTCVGFALTVVTIQGLGALVGAAGVDPGLAFLLLAPGPVVGCAATYRAWPVHRALCRRKAASAASKVSAAAAPEPLAPSGARSTTDAAPMTSDATASQAAPVASSSDASS